MADTTGWSALHAIFRSIRPANGVGWFLKIYALCVLFTYVPLLIVAALEPYPLAQVTHAVKLPFLLDWNIAFTFFVSFPMLVMLVLTDKRVLDRSLATVQAEHVITIRPGSTGSLASTWTGRFRWANAIAQALGFIIGLLSGAGILYAATASASGPWFAPGGHLLPISYVYLTAIALLLAVIVIFICRCVWLAVFLSDIVDQADVAIQPFHPDCCGGLRPVGQIGLRNQYTVTVLGLNVVIFIVVSYLHSQHRQDELYVLIAAVALYLVCGPVVFLGPLLPFHRAMLRDKQLASGEVAERLRVEFERIRKEIPQGVISQLDEEVIKRLRWIGDAVEALPVWPFDAATLRKFASAYAIPVGAALASHLIQKYTGLDIPLP